MTFFRALFLVLGGWFLLAQGSCMRMRTNDASARQTFSTLGIDLRTQTLLVGQRTMHYVSVGDSTQPTLVFIHGSPGSWDAFADYLKDADLRQKYRLVSVDRPGFGYSDFGQAEAISRQLELLIPVLVSLKNSHPMYLIGHSLGGPIALHLATQPGLTIGGVVILAGSVSPADEPRELWRKGADSFLFSWLLPGAMRPSNHELRLFKQDVLAMPALMPLVKCPVVLVHGKKDPLVPPHNAEFAQQTLVNAQSVKMVWFEDANHFIPWTRYNAIKAILMELSAN